MEPSPLASIFLKRSLARSLPADPLGTKLAKPGNDLEILYDGDDVSIMEY